MLDNARNLIDLTNKIYVVLEPPDSRMWDILKPILSHDNYEITHDYVHDVPGYGFVVKKILTRGWRAFIVCNAANHAKCPE
jgi:hypothetical protein